MGVNTNNAVIPYDPVLPGLVAKSLDGDTVRINFDDSIGILGELISATISEALPQNPTLFYTDRSDLQDVPDDNGDTVNQSLADILNASYSLGTPGSTPTEGKTTWNSGNAGRWLAGFSVDSRKAGVTPVIWPGMVKLGMITKLQADLALAFPGRTRTLKVGDALTGALMDKASLHQDPSTGIWTLSTP